VARTHPALLPRPLDRRRGDAELALRQGQLPVIESRTVGRRQKSRGNRANERAAPSEAIMMLTQPCALCGPAPPRQERPHCPSPRPAAEECTRFGSDEVDLVSLTCPVSSVMAALWSGQSHYLAGRGLS